MIISRFLLLFSGHIFVSIRQFSKFLLKQNGLFSAGHTHVFYTDPIEYVLKHLAFILINS